MQKWLSNWMLLVLKNILGILLKADCGASMVYVLRTFKKWQTPKVHQYMAQFLKKCLFEPWFIISIFSGMPYRVVRLLSKYYTIKIIPRSLWHVLLKKVVYMWTFIPTAEFLFLLCITGEKTVLDGIIGVLGTWVTIYSRIDYLF